MDDTRHLVSEFLTSIAIAKHEGQEWVETSKEIIAHYNKRGLGVNPVTGKENRFFIYDGVKVCEPGMIESIEQEMNTQLGVRIHGKDEGIVEGK